MKRSSTVGGIAAGVALGTIAAWVIVSAAAAPRTVALPDDHVGNPGTVATRAAVRAARAEPDIARLLDGRSRSIDHRWHHAEPCSQTCIATIFYNYDADALVEVYTSTAGDVLAVETGKGQPPVSPDEQVHAHLLAERDAKVRALLAGEQHVHGAPAYSLYPDDGVCARHRCATVIFMLDGLAATGKGRQLHVLVDLSEDRIVERTRQRCDGICEEGW